MELKPSDNKLLAYLFHHNREPLSKIAKATKLSREQVKYKLEKYIGSGLIRKFFTVFDWSKLGYNYLAVLIIKFEKLSSLPKFTKELEKSKNMISFGKVYGKYDLYITAIFKNEIEFSEFLSALLGATGHLINDYIFIKPFFGKVYPLRFLGSNETGDYPMIRDNISKTIELDEKDRKILKMLSDDARIKLVDMASKINTSGEVVLHRIKRLKKQGIILGPRTHFNMKKMGYFFTVIFIDIKNFSKVNQDKLKDFANKTKNVDSIVFSHSRPNCFMQIFHKDEETLRKTINDLKELFVNSQISVEPLLIEDQENEANMLPFY